MKTAEVTFWDSSGIMLLCAHQAESSVARRLARGTRMAIWWGTSVEVKSALSRLHRERLLRHGDVIKALARFHGLALAAIEIAPSEEVRALAVAALDTHDIRAADALQLASALALCERKPRRRPFICFDRRLARAASDAGFTVLP